MIVKAKLLHVQDEVSLLFREYTQFFLIILALGSLAEDDRHQSEELASRSKAICNSGSVEADSDV